MTLAERLRQIADNPWWSTVCRMEAKTVDPAELDLPDDATDPQIGAALVARIKQRANDPGIPDDPRDLAARIIRNGDDAVAWRAESREIAQVTFDAVAQTWPDDWPQQDAP